MKPRVSTRSRMLVRRRVEAAMLGRIQIIRGGLGTLNATTGVVGGLTDGVTIYKGKGKVGEISGSETISVGGAEIAVRRVIISYPIDAPVAHRDDVVAVLDDDDADPSADTPLWRVLDVDGGGLIGDARRMTCSSFFQSPYWGAQ